MSTSPTPPPPPSPGPRPSSGPPPASRVTIKDVAALAGVSKGAVSLAFNRKPGLADATRDRIFAAARQLGWAPNLAARSLSSQRVDVVGLAICRPARQLGLEPFYMEFISGVESVLTERSCSLLLRLVRNLEEEVGLQDAWWRGRQVSGSILVDFRADDPRVAAVGRLAIQASKGASRAPSAAHSAEVSEVLSLPMSGATTVVRSASSAAAQPGFTPVVSESGWPGFTRASGKRATSCAVTVMSAAATARV